jgi:hypothetical protein
MHCIQNVFSNAGEGGNGTKGKDYSGSDYTAQDYAAQDYTGQDYTHTAQDYGAGSGEVKFISCR